MRVPSWLKITAVTGSECAGSVFNVLPILRLGQGLVLGSTSVPRATSQTRTDSSNPPDASMLEEGLKFTQKTKLVCPYRTLGTAFCPWMRIS